MASPLEAGSGTVFVRFEDFLETFNAYFYTNKVLFVRESTAAIGAVDKSINLYRHSWV